MHNNSQIKFNDITWCAFQKPACRKQLLAFFKYCFLLLVPVFALPVLSESFSSDEPIKQVKHDFWIKFTENDSKTDYELTQLELLTGNMDISTPHIKTSGSLILRSKSSVAKCQVKLPSSFIDASNEKGENLKLRLSGKIGDKILTTDFLNPNFNEYNQANFSFQAYIDPSSFEGGLSAGDYEYKNNLKLNIEFKD